MKEDSNDKRLMTGLFKDRESAERAYNYLHDRGYSKDEINLIMSDETRKRHFDETKGETEIGTKAMEGAGKGSAIGGAIGAVAGVIAALGTSLVIPGLGVVIAGPIAAGLAGAGAGGFTGGLIGALIGWGIPEERARIYESKIKEGGIVMGVNPKDQTDEEYIENDWRENKVEDIYGTRTRPTPTEYQNNDANWNR
ncbi:MAG TPA: hypothetical protein VHO90_04900 [Bacteroidales bacterium]|nr:hypothetical protein [Bacteroidales bacterium]